jgi:tetratricopeptide (TPR) repeat protein
MPKRHAEDAPHVMITDHRVQRSPAAAGAATWEGYRGPVELYYPESSARDPEIGLYEAVAQVRDGSNLAGGVPLLEQAIRNSHPRTGFFHFELAEALRHAGRPYEAAVAYREALRRPGERAGWRLGLAHALAAAGDLKGAIAAAEGGRSRWPADARLPNLLGDLYRRAGRAADAIRVLQGLELPEAATNLGVALAAAGRIEEAQRAFEEAIRLQPDAASAHNNLAVLLFRRQQAEAALGHAESAARLAPHDVANRLTYATILAQTGRRNEAGAEWEAALAINPDQAETHMNLGTVRRGNGDVSGAIRHYRRAVELKPELAQAHFLLAECLEETRDLQAAERHYREAIRHGPGAGPAHLRLGRLLMRTGKQDEGRRLLEQAATSANPRVRAQAVQALKR